MSKQANSTVIGAFVVIGMVLTVVSVVLFGGSEYFAKREKYSVYFDDDTKGLRVGSNVLLNGVRIGYVSEISLLMDKTTFTTISLVTLEILPDTFLITDEGQVVGTGAGEVGEYEGLIYQAGLRAQLEIESFLTGQLVVNLSLQPYTPSIMRGIDSPYPEIPTISSDVQLIMAQLKNWIFEVAENVDAVEVSRRFNRIIRGLDELSNSQDLRAALAGINQLINDKQTQQLAGTAIKAFKQVDAMALDASQLIQHVDGRVVGLGSDLTLALSKLTSLLTEAEQTLVMAKKQLRGETVQMYQLEATLKEIESASRAVRAFFDYLERNPEALLTGKKDFREVRRE
ncbi:MlaD family protein [Photobacterium sp. J15]|uniref:MlaD family protein n=1 Tax=Photobacterium sp. J15 TaxID=265901 RepID=UPI0007E4C5F9|nr:MlaD family protein [Photobacterium sp. J15]